MILFAATVNLAFEILKVTWEILQHMKGQDVAQYFTVGFFLTVLVKY